MRRRHVAGRGGVYYSRGRALCGSVIFSSRGAWFQSEFREAALGFSLGIVWRRSDYSLVGRSSAAASPVTGTMKGSETGVLVPSGSLTEVETWVKFSKIPVEFLTVDALSMISSSIGCPVRMDEDTFEKMEDAKWPPPLRRNKSKRTFVKILMRICVTAPLPPSVDVVCPKGRKYTILIASYPTPKVCLNCFCDGHFDFECCDTEEATVEIMEDDVVAVEDLLGVDLQLDDCFESKSDEVDGEQGAVSTDGVESYEDSTVVEAVKLPAATCDIGGALVGELEAVHTILDGLCEQSLVERTAAVLEVQSLLPATIAADGCEGTVISDGFVCYEDPPVVKAVLEVSPHSLPPASCEFGAAKAGDLEAVQTFSDSSDDEPLVGKEITADLLASVGDSIDTDLQKLAADPFSDGFHEEPTMERIDVVSCLVDEQVSSIELPSFEDFSLVKSSRQHHKWREKTVEQRFLEGDSGSGMRLLDVDLQDADCRGGILAYIDGVQGAVIIDRAVCYVNPPDFEAALVEDFHYIEQVFFVVKSSNKHHKWRDKSDVQGLFCCSSVLGFSGFDEQSSVEIKETTAVLPFSVFGDANFGTSPAAILQGRADFCIDIETFEEWYVLHGLGRLMAATNSTHDQLIFKIQHKWRDKSMDWSADRFWAILMCYKKKYIYIYKKKKKKERKEKKGYIDLIQHADGLGLLYGCCS